MKFTPRKSRRFRKQPSNEQSEQPFFSKSNQTILQTKEDKPFFQAKLAIGQPGDKYEREADAVADAVVNNNGQAPVVQRQGISFIQRTTLATPLEDEKLSTAEARMERDKEIQEKPEVQRMESPEEEEPVQMQSEEEEEEPVQMMGEEEEEVQMQKEEEEEPVQMQSEEEEEPVQMMGEEKEEVQMQTEEEEEPLQMMHEEEEEPLQAKSIGSTTPRASSKLSNKIESNSGKGKAMPDNTRAEMENSFGVDFSGVNIHTDQSSLEMNKELGAQAFTHGQDVYFNSGKFRPESSDGKRLLAHELTHVVQQGGSSIQRNKNGQSPVQRFGEPLVQMNYWLLNTCISRGYAQRLNSDELAEQIRVGRESLTSMTDTTQRQTLIGNIKVLENEVRSRELTAGTNAILEDVANAGDATARREAALRLATYARANITRIADIENYLQGPDSDENKMATLGQLAVQHGKVEFLLGWIYEGGLSDLSNTGQQRGWENDGANRGAFPTHYQNEMHNVQGGDRWCTTFAGYLYKTIGMRDEIRGGSVFRSGYRLRKWAMQGQTNSGSQITEEDQTVASGAGGAALIDKADWRTLRRGLFAATTAQARNIVTQNFFAPEHSRPYPQPGDTMIIGGSNNNFQNGHSHTVMVEHFDVTNYTISTIEGNNEDSVYSRIIDLKDPAQVSGIVSLIRMGTQHFGNQENDGTPATAPTDVDQINRYDLMTPIESVVARLVGFASAPDRLWICSSDPGATTNEWINGPLCNQPAVTTGSTH